MIRFYVLPLEGSGVRRGPKYLTWPGDPDPPGLECQWTRKDYGRLGTCVLCADVTPAINDALAAQGDVFGFAQDLGLQMSAKERARLAAVLAAAWMPSYWLEESQDYRAALRKITAMCLYVQKLTLSNGDIRHWGIELSTSWSSLNAFQKEEIKQAAWKCLYTIDFITAWSSIAQIISGMADQFGNRPIDYGLAEI